jgi:hypothetical protein
MVYGFSGTGLFAAAEFEIRSAGISVLRDGFILSFTITVVVVVFTLYCYHYRSFLPRCQ